MPAGSPPVAPQRPFVRTHHGIPLSDPYAWLRDREDPAVHAHLEAENAWTESQTAHLTALRDALYDEMLGRIQEDDTSVPWEKGPFVYYSRTVEGRPYAIHCRRPAAGGAEEVLLDENKIAEDHDYFHLGALEVSPDHRRIAWAADTTGAERYRILVRDLETNELLPGPIEGAKPSIAWANDSRTLFWTVPDTTDRPHRLFRRDVMQPDAPETLVLEEPDGRFYLHVERTRDDRFLLASLESKITSEVHVLDADDPTGTFRVIQPRTQGIEYWVEPHGTHFYVLTNEDAVNFELVRIPIVPDPSLPREVVIPHDANTYLTDIDLFADHLVVWERRDGLPTLRIRELSTGNEHRVSFPDPTYVLSSAPNPRFDTTILRFTYESPVMPSSVFDYDMNTREKALRKRQPVPGYDEGAYRCDRVFATSADGTQVPISLVYREGTRPTGDHPMLLVGYGAYGVIYEPWFRSSWISLMDRGVVCGIAHVRGGGELGRTWYEEGKLSRKPRTFQDFIACAETLQDLGWTCPERLAIQGGSAGGLLIGAVINARPDVCRAALALVPFVDVLNTMFDETLPLTVIEYEEWGDPNDKASFETIYSYSPYDNVVTQAYPDLLVTAGLNDPRVGYWEPAKWVARLRAHNTGTGPLLLKTNLGAGHAGASGRYGRLEETAFEYAFVLDRIAANDRLSETAARRDS